MEIPMTDFSELKGKDRSKTMALFHDACEKWGFFQIEKHGVDKVLMEKVKNFISSHYGQNLKANFYESEIAKRLVTGRNSETDWETTFLISNVNQVIDPFQWVRESSQNNWSKKVI